MKPADLTDSTRRSWNVATRNHNRHKGDQGAFLREGGELLFPEELVLLGDLTGQRLVHLQCNSGQDSLCLARRGAQVTGVDLSDEAIDVARRLSSESGLAAEFVHAEVVSWMAETDRRFDLVFASYGALGWIADLSAWMRGAARVLVPGGRLVIVEFHPIAWSLGELGGGDADDYFSSEPFFDPVGDYVAQAGPSLQAPEGAREGENPIDAVAWQHPLARILQAVVDAGLCLERLDEHPHSNGARLFPRLVPGPDRVWQWPTGTPRLPLMFSLRARRRGSDA